ncbi:MAG TPA: hypothetical protein VG889_05145 [Rhizomicrobium sp.]|nr:hypothetical protein [Rhizomicrobium sp.]
MQGQRLWILIGAAVIVVAALGAGAWWWLGHGHKPTVASRQPQLIGDLGETAHVLDNTLPDEGKICAVTLTRALDFGAVPAGATLTSDEAKANEGRYSCDAQGADGKYTMVVDASCANGTDKSCFTLDSITREDGTVVYKRRPWPYQD